jgi:hypothetical protein
MNSKKALLVISVVSLLLIIFGYFFQENLRGGVLEVLGLILLITGYISGLFAFILGFFFTLFYIIVSLPLISVAYGWILFTLSRVHYTLFNLVFRRILGRMGWYRDLDFRIKNSERYKDIESSIDRFLKRLGLKSPTAIKVFQINRCRTCGEVKPVDARFCPYCGKRLT